ncbi:hypothetical protein F5884DRAFT_179783 [Xylogone sp. PMI_703]|nr:hypothetical protein F5884DRAFT_179783 [Xylogone sp. PMI_703]
MVSFSCEACGDVLTKKKLDPHRNSCRGASFTCIDCMVHFHGTDYRAHTSCMTEAQKYQGALYRPEKDKSNKAKQNNKNAQQSQPQTPIQQHSRALVPRKPYVQDEDDVLSDEFDTSANIAAEHPSSEPEDMPEAPSPPQAVPGFVRNADNVHEPVNVFDFLVASSTPNQSRFDLPDTGREPSTEPMHLIDDRPYYEGNQPEPPSQDLVRVHFDDNVEYGSGPVATAGFQTPAPRDRERRQKEHDLTSTSKKSDKKRKRLHVDTANPDGATRNFSGDHIMTDAPPAMLHSGLTGGLNRMMRPDAFPPSPDYSGDAGGGEPSPGSPIKKTKRERERERAKNNKSSKSSKSKKSKEKEKEKRRSSGLKSDIAGLFGASTKEQRERDGSEDRPRKHHRKHRHHRDSSPRSGQKLLEYKTGTPDDGDANGQMILYKPLPELFLSLVNKGPESEKGVSFNKALKRFHRELENNGGETHGKSHEEKELWRNLRLRRNAMGEVVLFMA